MIAWTDVVNLPAPELATVPVDAQDAIIDRVYRQLDADTWGDQLDDGAAYLAAHLATIGRRGGAGGPVVSESVGQVARAYAASIAQGAAQLGSTAYGLEFERLVMQLVDARMPVVG